MGAIWYRVSLSFWGNGKVTVFVEFLNVFQVKQQFPSKTKNALKLGLG